MMSEFSYKQQYAVIVKCSSEDEQMRVFELLKQMGLSNLKVVSV